MTTEEKILMVEMLLQDVRNNWADPTTERVTTAASLCKEIGGKSFELLASVCQEYLEDNVTDGRFFREEFPYGYISMDEIHKLDRKLEYKSEEFITLATRLITCPEMAFSTK